MGTAVRAAAGPRYEATEDAAPRRARFRPAGYSGGGPPAGAKGGGRRTGAPYVDAGHVGAGHADAGGTPGRGGSEPAPRGPRLSLGKIIHPTFGRGEVIAQDGTGPEARLTVLFPGGITKKIVARYAQWEVRCRFLEIRCPTSRGWRGWPCRKRKRKAWATIWPKSWAYVRKLDALDAGGASTRTEDALPGAGGATPFRADSVTASLPVEVALGLSQDHDGNFFRVPPVIEREDA